MNLSRVVLAPAVAALALLAGWRSAARPFTPLTRCIPPRALLPDGAGGQHLLPSGDSAEQGGQRGAGTTMRGADSARSRLHREILKAQGLSYENVVMSNVYLKT